MLSNVRAAIPLLESDDAAPPEKTITSRSARNRLRQAASSESHSTQGRKTFAFWTLVALLLLLAAGNLLLTVTVLSVLRLGRGMESIEPVPEASTILLSGEVDFEHVYHRGGVLRGFRDSPLSVEATAGGSVRLALTGRNPRAPPHRLLSVSPEGVSFDGISSFTVARDSSSNVAFSTSSPTYDMPLPTKNLVAKLISANRIVAPVDRDLTLRSEGVANLRGTEGTHMDAGKMIWSADQDIYLRSANGTVVLGGKGGVFVNVDHLPIAGDVHPNAKGHFKLCVCMPQGKLFRLPVPTGQAAKTICSHVNLAPKYNPCI